MRMIELHYKQTGNLVWLNPNEFVSIESVNGITNHTDKYTEITTSNDSCYMVSETPEEVRALAQIDVIKKQNQPNQIYQQNEIAPRSPKKPYRKSRVKSTPWSKQEANFK